MIRFYRFSILMLFITAFSAFSLPAFAMDDEEFNPQTAFNRGNFLFEQQQFEAALDLYREIEESGHVSGALFLNMGLTYSRLELYGNALYYFTLAEQFSQSRSTARQAIRHMSDLLDQRRTPIAVLSTISIFKWFHFEKGSRPFLILALVLLNLGAILLGFWLIYLKKHKILKYAGFTILLIGVLSLIVGMFLNSQSDRYQLGMFVDISGTIHEIPDAASEPVFMVYEGYTFVIDVVEKERRIEALAGRDNVSLVAPDDWIYVQMSNGIEGWMLDEGYREVLRVNF